MKHMVHSPAVSGDMSGEMPCNGSCPGSLGQALEQLCMLQPYISDQCQQLQSENDMLRSENDMLRSACTAGGLCMSSRVPVSSRRFPATLLSPPLQPVKEQESAAQEDQHLLCNNVNGSKTLHATVLGVSGHTSAGEVRHPSEPALKRIPHSSASGERNFGSMNALASLNSNRRTSCNTLESDDSDTADMEQKQQARCSTRSVGSVYSTHRESVFDEFKKSQKEQVRLTLAMDPNKDPYKKVGFCQQIVRSSRFDKLSHLLVCSNLLWIAFDADCNHAESLYSAHPGFIIGANIFCMAFLLELLVRWFALNRKRFFFRDKMNIIDTISVLCLVLETWLLPIIQSAVGANSNTARVGDASILRMVRLARLARIATVTKLLRAMPELLVIMESMKAALRAVALTLLLLTLLLFLFGVAFRLLSIGSELSDSFFKSVPVSMYNLLVYGVLSLDEVGPIAIRLEKVGSFLPILFFTFVLLVACCVMNMLIGVMCEVVKEASRLLEEKIQVENVTAKISKMLDELGGPNGMTNGRMRISKDDLFLILGNRSALLAFQEMGTDIYALVDWADSIFWDPVTLREKELTVPEFMQVVMNLRATKLATVKHILNLEKVVQRNTDLIMAALGQERASA